MDIKFVSITEQKEYGFPYKGHYLYEGSETNETMGWGLFAITARLPYFQVNDWGEGDSIFSNNIIPLVTQKHFLAKGILKKKIRL